ncbi:MAG: lamin tail domain-containing protein, partial [Planctomycetota bacterium]|nr:lamin tail domain-containing protein [Planctomycetota bacterium]
MKLKTSIRPPSGGGPKAGNSIKILLLSLIFTTLWASSALAHLYPIGDLNEDRKVDSKDLLILARQWLSPSCLIPGCEADLDGADGVNMVDLAILAENWETNKANAVISEFMASNDSKEPLEEGELLDEEGDSSDWVEIYNPTDSAVNLKGWYLTDDANDLRRWELPSIQISPGQFKIIFASEKNRDDPDGQLHANFKLTSSGGFLALVKPDGKTIAHAYEYPQQFGDISYGLADPNSKTGATQVLVPEFTDAKALIPTNGLLGLSWTDRDFNDSSWLKGKTGVGYENNPGDPVNYTSLINLNAKTQMYNKNGTCYIRIPFEMDDLSNLEGLKLLMKYDDGFVAYLNGHSDDPIASANAPSPLQWNSAAPADRSDSAAVNFQEFPLPDDYIDYLQIGTNVLAIHGLNKSTGSSDFLILPKLTVNRTETIDFSSAVEGYFFGPTPGSINSGIVINLGPAIRNVTENPPQPTDTQNLIITAQVTETFKPVAWVKLFFRVDFGSETNIQMFDDGLHNDGAAGDNIYGAVIPASASGPADCVRWYVTASDVNNNISRNPLFLINSGNRQSPQYFGTVVVDPSINTALPVFHYFVQDTSSEGTRTGTRASVFYLGEFYDNVYIRLRGGYTTHGRKIEFNDGHHFCFDPNLPRVDEINLNEKGADPTYMRQVLGWEAYFNAGQPGSISFPLHVRRNGSFLDVRIFIEQEDRDMLRRNGLDPDGALYKMYDDLQNGQIDGEGVHEKKTRLDEDASDLLALAAGINTTNPNRNVFVFD